MLCSLINLWVILHFKYRYLVSTIYFFPRISLKSLIWGNRSLGVTFICNWKSRNSKYSSKTNDFNQKKCVIMGFNPLLAWAVSLKIVYFIYHNVICRTKQYLLENSLLLILLLMLFIYINGIIFLCIAVEAMSLLTVFRAKLHRICTRLSAFLTLLIRIECSVLRKLQL